MNRKPKKICTTQDYIKHFLILASSVTRCISISAFTYLIDIGKIPLLGPLLF